MRNLPDLLEIDPPRPAVIETHSEFRGNRLTHRFYPQHYANVQLARHNAERYGTLTSLDGDA